MTHARPLVVQRGAAALPELVSLHPVQRRVCEWRRNDKKEQKSKYNARTETEPTTRHILEHINVFCWMEKNSKKIEPTSLGHAEFLIWGRVIRLRNRQR